MADGLPRVDGLSAKLRGEHYTAPRLAEQSEGQKGPAMKKRARYYRGRKLAAQPEMQKGPVMKKRARYYRGRKLAEQPETQKGSAMKKRARYYRGRKLAAQPEMQKGPVMKKRARYYRGRKLAEQPETQKGPAMIKRAGSYRAAKERESGERPFYVTNCEFQLILGNCIINCARISNLIMEQEVETVPEGGSPFLNLFPSDKKKPDILTVEKALISDEVMENLEAGVQIREGIIAVYRGKAFVQAFSFDEGMITKCEYTNLDAMGQEIMLKKLEITHSGLEAWPGSAL